MWKALSVIAAILAAGAASLSFLNKGDVELERELKATSENNLKDINARFLEVKADQESYIVKNTKMEERRETALEEQEAEKTKLETKTQEVMDTDDRIKELETEIAESKAQIAEFGNIEQLMALINQLQTDLFTSKNQIAVLEDQLVASQSREVSTTKRIQSYKDLEFRQRNGEMVSISAPITTVHNTWGFVVLGAGDRQGVVSRTRLNVNRGGDKIAELVVTNLEKNRSVCDIVPGSMQPGQSIRPGDRVSVNSASLPKPKATADPARPAAPSGGAGIPEMPADPAGQPAPASDPNDPFADLNSAPPAESTDPAPDDSDPFSDL